MNGKRRGRGAPAVVLILSVWTAAVATGAVVTPAAEPETGEIVPPSAGCLGIVDWEGNFSLVHEEAGPGYFRFWEEPRILRIDPKGPAAGKILPGDRVVSANGHLITTEKGSRFFSVPDPGEEVELLLRRRDEEITVRIIAVHGHPESRGSLPNVPALPCAPLPPAALAAGELLPAPNLPHSFRPRHDSLPHTWLGMGLTCEIEGRWGEEDLRFVEPPTVFRVVSGSAAEKARFRKGDVITAIDGTPIDTREGTACFAAIRAGERVEWTVRREGEEVRLSMTAAPSSDGPRPTRFAPPVKDILYAGTVGSAAVEVRGSSSISVEEDREKGEILIRTAEGTIRVWIPDHPAE
ncbi:MAG: PDZ domain-containing protein [Candidatus Eisenbacteria bacterium]|nr:PDZ domain-containing protein [Candidatus Eisenbacteria bacterium]